MADESWRLPDIVQELAAAGVQEPPSRYLLRQQDRVAGQLAGAEIPEPIPTIDLGIFLPVEERKKHSNLIDGKHLQIEGYGNDPVQTKDQILDWCDRLHLRVEPEGDRNLAFWPSHPKSFRDILHEYTSKIKKIKNDILLAVSNLLGLDEDCLAGQFSEKAITTARFNYDSPCPSPDLVLGLRPHSDLCALTVLLMDKDIGGLLVLRDGDWYNVPVVFFIKGALLPRSPTETSWVWWSRFRSRFETVTYGSPIRPSTTSSVPVGRDYSFLINIGVTLEIMTNGIFRAPVHRVVTNADRERMSVAMFYAVDGERETEPVADLLSLKQPTRYRKI